MTTRTAKKIKHLMIEKGISGAEIARRAGVVRQAIYNVVAGSRKSPQLREAIAEALGVSTDSLWPTKPHERESKRKAA
jgi:lambda repressor-like predicted transcriptional regulator